MAAEERRASLSPLTPPWQNHSHIKIDEHSDLLGPLGSPFPYSAPASVPFLVFLAHSWWKHTSAPGCGTSWSLNLQGCPCRCARGSSPNSFKSLLKCDLLRGLPWQPYFKCKLLRTPLPPPGMLWPLCLDIPMTKTSLEVRSGPVCGQSESKGHPGSLRASAQATAHMSTPCWPLSSTLGDRRGLRDSGWNLFPPL